MANKFLKIGSEATLILLGFLHVSGISASYDHPPEGHVSTTYVGSVYGVREFVDLLDQSDLAHAADFVVDVSSTPGQKFLCDQTSAVRP